MGTDQGGSLITDQNIDEMANMVLRDLKVTPNDMLTVEMQVGESCLKEKLTVRQAQVDVKMTEAQITPILLSFVGASVRPSVIEDFKEPTPLHLVGPKNVSFPMTPSNVGGTNYSKVDIGDYEIFMGDKPMGSFKADQGGVYSLLVAKNPETAIDR